MKKTIQILVALLLLQALLALGLHFGGRSELADVAPPGEPLLAASSAQIDRIAIDGTDPDGVTGAAEQTVTARTRAKPRAAKGGHVYHVYPFGFKGPMQQPAFFGLMAAYYFGSDETDHYNAEPPRVVPGSSPPAAREVAMG